MSSVVAITSIIVLLATLVCYAFVAQSITNKRRQKERLLTGLKARSRNFKFMLNGFPEGFLPKDLKLLIQRCLMQVSEQLSRLEPQQSSHTEDFQLISQQMAETQRQPPQASKAANLENPQQLREVKACLEELYKFVFQLEAKRNLTHPQAESYRAMIKHLVLVLTVDSYLLHARMAREKGKLRLSKHYYELGLSLMVREGKDGQFDAKIQQVQAISQELEQRIAESSENAPPIPKSKQQASDEVAEEWESFQKEDAGWKKKQIYD